MVRKLWEVLKMIKSFVKMFAKSSTISPPMRKSHSEAIRNIGVDAYDWFAAREGNPEALRDVSKVIDHQKWTFSEKLTDLDCTYTDYKKDDVELELHAHTATGVCLTATGKGSKEKLEAIKNEFDKMKA
jgi:hypothetical protein